MSKSVKIFLIVFGGFALVPIYVIATFAIPGLQSKRGPHTSAIASLRMLSEMESEYSSTYPDHGFACSLVQLGGKPQAGPPTPEAAQLIPDDLASGRKAGYIFLIANCTKKIVNGRTQSTSYQIFAVPAIIRHTSDYGYCTDETAQIKFDPKGGTNCTELLQ